jgi:hypothetical protein
MVWMMANSEVLVSFVAILRVTYSTILGIATDEIKREAQYVSICFFTRYGDCWLKGVQSRA